MTLPITTRLRETATKIQREEAIHLRNLRELLSEAADEIDRLSRGGGEVRPKGPKPISAMTRILPSGGGEAKPKGSQPKPINAMARYLSDRGS